MKATIQDIDQWEYDVERSVVPSFSLDAERDLPGAINKFIVTGQFSWPISHPKEVTL